VTARPGDRNLITDVPGLRVGHAYDAGIRTGVTVLLADTPVVAAVDVRGGGPASREIDVLSPENLVQTLDAVVLSGGSVYGLGAADGVTAWLGARGRGFGFNRPNTPLSPIVPTACLYDLANEGNKAWGLEPPYRRLGLEAVQAVSAGFDLGGVGAGFGARAGTLLGGIGSASMILGEGWRVGALAAVNSHGSVTVPGGRHFWAAPFEIDGEFGGLGPGAPLSDPEDWATTPSTPFIGTGGDGHTFPGRGGRSAWCSSAPTPRSCRSSRATPARPAIGYGDPTILGFSHTHFSGSGHSDLGDILLTPVAGEAKLEPGASDKPGSGYRSRYSHDTEVAQPGYYAVTLTDSRVRAELTAGLRTGLHRYTFQKGDRAQVLLDLRTSIYNYPGKVSWSRIRVAEDGTVTGYRETRGWAPGRQLYFAIRFDRPLVGQALYNTRGGRALQGLRPAGPHAQRPRPDPGPRPGRGVRLRPDRRAADRQGRRSRRSARTGRSPTSPATRGRFRLRRPARRDQGRLGKALGAVEIDAPPRCGPPSTPPSTTPCWPPACSRRRRPLSRADDQVHEGKLRGLHLPLDLFAVGHLPRRAPAADPGPAGRTRNSDVVNSLIASQQESPYGILPVWQFHGQETWTMIGYHAVPVIADAYEGHPRLRRQGGPGRHGQERDLRPLWRSRRLHGPGLRADRQGAGGRVQDRRIRL
jgi:hypothetical protein